MTTDLKAIFQRQGALLDSLAQSWSAQGAHLVDSGGETLYRWGAAEGTPRSLLLLGGEAALTLWFGSKVSPPGLEAQIALLDRFLAGELELEATAEELSQTYDQLVGMYEISRAARRSLESGPVTQHLLEQTIQLTQASGGSVALHRPESGWECIAEHGDAPTPDVLEHIWARAAGLDRTLVENTPISGRAGCPDSLVAGLFKAGEARQGLLALVNKRTGPFTAGDAKLIQAFAEETGGLLERDALYRRMVQQERLNREMEIAQTIQSTLLPHEMPAIPGADLAGASQPATEVGGDFFDVQVLRDNRVGLVLGDVTGKGVPAALFMAMTRALLRATLGYTTSLESVLPRVNRQLYNDLTRVGMFVTLFVGIYAPRRRVFHYTNAGHSPVLYYDPSARKASLWLADGPPVGVLPTLAVPVHRYTLPPGAVLAVLSDGFNETFSPAGEMLGTDALEQTLAAHGARETPADAITRALFEQVETFGQGRPAPDDRTALVLRILAPRSA